MRMPLNGPDYWRQLDIVDPIELKKFSFQLIGAGGIGSPTALALCKMGASRLTIWDDDHVENHNFPNQIYRYSDLGQFKAVALRDILGEFASTEVTANTRRITRDSAEDLSGIVISAVDTMAARSEIWEKVHNNPEVLFYIEARMGAEALMICSLNPNDQDLADWYAKTLYSDDEVVEAPCTQQAIIYTVFVAGGFIANQVKKYVCKQVVPKEVMFDLKNMVNI